MTTTKTTTSTNYTAGEAITILTGEITELNARLDKGWALLEVETDPEKRERYETRWFSYLKKYEEKCQLRRDLGYVHPGK